MTESFKFYEVGGKIRDELLGLKSKDVDYVAVPTNELLYKDYTAEECLNFFMLTWRWRSLKSSQ